MASGSGYWMGDDQQQQNWSGYNQNQNDWYAQQQSTTGSQDMGWGQFDYSQPQQPSAPQPNPANNYYSQQSSYGGYPQSGNMFIPGQQPAPAGNEGIEDFENEPPLLEELGINFSHIKEKTVAVLNPMGGASVDVIADQDLAGPLVFCLLFGAALLLHGKMQFGYIYGIGALGCVGMYALMNLMAGDKSISFTCTTSVLGYCLLPMALLSLMCAVLSFKGIIGYSVSLLAVLWCSVASSKLFVIALQLDHQRLLVAYPCVLLYSVFALLAIF
ncbi:unnamed protein product, partial [Mesorhabditis belari]|uniref:Protein YIPF n=1 Tax=Mesorhabditis belari TaxID=2138241 RepID=A0AAF3EE28_9BILA